MFMVNLKHEQDLREINSIRKDKRRVSTDIHNLHFTWQWSVFCLIAVYTHSHNERIISAVIKMRTSPTY